MFLRRRTTFPQELAWYRMNHGLPAWPYDPDETYAEILGMVSPYRDPVPLVIWVAKLVQGVMGYRWARSIMASLLKLPVNEWYQEKKTIHDLIRITSISSHPARDLIQWLKEHRLPTPQCFRWRVEVVRSRWPYLDDEAIVRIVTQSSQGGIDANPLDHIGDNAGLLRRCLAADLIQNLVNHGHDVPKDLGIIDRLADEIDQSGQNHQVVLRDSLTVLLDQLIVIDLLLAGIERGRLGGLRLPNRSLILATAFRDESLDGIVDESPTVMELADLSYNEDHRTALSLLVGDVYTLTCLPQCQDTPREVHDTQTYYSLEGCSRETTWWSGKT